MWHVHQNLYMTFSHQMTPIPRYFDAFPLYGVKPQQDNRTGAEIISDLISDFDKIARRAGKHDETV